MVNDKMTDSSKVVQAYGSPFTLREFKMPGIYRNVVVVYGDDL